VKINKPLLTLLCGLLLSSTALAEPTIEETANVLNNEWSEIFYRLPGRLQAEKYEALLPRIREFKAQNPQSAEPLILEAITLCTLAATEWGFSSLSRVREARDLLLRAIDLNPKAMEGTALITLGNLYYRLPGWPISFGDDEIALQYLETAVKLYPESLDSNYFLGDYWLNEEEYDKAIKYLEKADKIPARPYHQISDFKVKGEVERALKAARERDNGRGSFFTEVTPDFEK
jgi:tetratricopeptide (TPR) repeat protein